MDNKKPTPAYGIMRYLAYGLAPGVSFPQEPGANRFQLPQTPDRIVLRGAKPSSITIEEWMRRMKGLESAREKVQATQLPSVEESARELSRFSQLPSIQTPLQPEDILLGQVEDQAAQQEMQRRFDAEVERRAKLSREAQIEVRRQIEQSNESERAFSRRTPGPSGQVTRFTPYLETAPTRLEQLGRFGYGAATGLTGAMILDFLSRYASSFGRTPQDRGIRYSGKART